MTLPHRTIPAVALATLLASCGGGDTAGAGRSTSPLEPVTRDSAGVTFRTHPLTVFGRAPLLVLDSAPIATLAGSIDKVEEDVTALRSLHLLSDGRIAAIDREAVVVVILDPSTGSRSTHGRRGSGPQELGSSSSISAVVGDTLLLYDGQNRRLAVVDPDSGFLGTFPLPASLLPLGRSADGAILGMISGFGGFGTANGEVRRSRNAIVSWLPGAQTADTVLEVDGSVMYYTTQSRNGRAVGITGRNVNFSPFPSHRQWGDLLLVAPADPWTLQRFDTDGVLREVITIDVPSIAPSDSLIRADVEQSLAGLEPEYVDTAGERLRQELMAVPVFERVPAYQGTAVTPGGLLWVLDFRIPRQEGWAATLLDQSGRILGRIEEPTGGPPTGWGDDRLLFRTTDDDGIATLTVRRIVRP